MKRCFAMLSCKLFRSPVCRFVAPLTLTPSRLSIFSSSGNYIFSIFLKTRLKSYSLFIVVYSYHHIEFKYVDFIKSCKVTCHLVLVILFAVLSLVLGFFGTVKKQNFGIKTQQVGTTVQNGNYVGTFTVSTLIVSSRCRGWRVLGVSAVLRDEHVCNYLNRKKITNFTLELPLYLLHMLQHFFSFDSPEFCYEIANCSRTTWNTFFKVNSILQCLWTAFIESPQWTLAGICLIPATSTHLTCLDEIQDWFPHTKPRKKTFILMCVRKQFLRYSPSIFWR
jgi:hypothetical protein